MTERKITYALNRIKACRSANCPIEALVRSQHLNYELIRTLYTSLPFRNRLKDETIRAILLYMIEDESAHQHLKRIINRKSLKSVRTWLKRSERFFKDLRSGLPRQTRELQHETDLVFALLKIAANKLLTVSPAHGRLMER